VYKNDGSKIFKLIETDNKELESINNVFDCVSGKVLSGKCTGTLHQIKPGKKSGELLTRPLSCFCQQCSQEDYKNCQNKGHTGGNFTLRKLDFGQSNVQRNNIATNEDDLSSDDLEDFDFDLDGEGLGLDEADLDSLAGDKKSYNDDLEGLLG
ncbi:MAG: hypothetical protein O4808_08180, partial [Trichodesmium sp. St17_bin3_1_1]|nr:hypothetical protein [Trichodesmium sp. St17_bin3_1_1]